MNTEKDNTKRKKRRTRKCLNEIRKRSQSYGGRCLAKDYVYESNKVKIPSNNITKNRLTLSMFPKAVRSETITRPSLAEIKHKQNLNDIVKDKKSPTLKNIILNEKFKIKSDEEYKTSDLLPETEKVNHDGKSIEDNESSFGDFMLVSPNWGKKDDSSLSSNKISCLMNPFSSISHEDTTELHTSFIKEPLLLKNNSSEALLKYDANNTLRSQIHEVSIGNFKSSLTTATNIKSDISAINRNMQDPIEYIRSAQKASDGITKLHHSSSGSSESEPYVNFPSLLNCSSIMQDAPEYNFYPHKLHH